MNELILLKNGEIALKGLNRSTFEDMLVKNLRHALHGVGKFKFYKAQSTIYAEPMEECDLDEAVRRLSRVFGVAALVRACIVEKDFEQIKAVAAEYLSVQLREARTFRVTAKRADKKFPLDSSQICRELGAHLLRAFPHLRVNLEHPDVEVVVEVRDFAAYLHAGQQPGAGGIPVGSSGRAMLLLSGGIDSPVAGYMMAKRGIKIVAVHFASPPYTSERALLKVHGLCEKMTPYCGRMTLLTVPFTEIQECIRRHCPEEYYTLVMRRFMMEIAGRLAEKNDCGALITGESIGQVASQTMLALHCTGAALDIPILRPVIGMDKEEIITVARRIDTFETSILPYEDCCTVFTPRHPKTKPRLDAVLAAEAALDREALVAQAVQGTTCRGFS